MQSLFNILSKCISFSFLKNHSDFNLILPFYHIISDNLLSHIYYIHDYKNTENFEKDLDFLLKHFNPINLKEILNCINNNIQLPKNSFHLTFDDGFREVYDIIAPILISRGISATIFLNSSFIDNKDLSYKCKQSILISVLKNSSGEKKESVRRFLLKNGIDKSDIYKGIQLINYKQQGLLNDIAYQIGFDFTNYLIENKPYMTTKEIKNLIEKGFTFGAHSVDHPDYTELSEDEKYRQTVESMALIKDKFKLDYSVFAFPFSDYGISESFFNKIFNDKVIDLSFGTGGLIKDVSPKIFQRVWMEYPNKPAKDIIKIQLFMSLIRTKMKKNYFRR
ncbi:MAG: hypothetical protein A2220_06140 [Ignavibacteria bacterium RIFOXYA2_FULL_35_10]|nr:MAG: hypothetical protein A2220_06140 [Ignavibacteria bacterium RIFOXYA2_FULL_35_10]